MVGHLRDSGRMHKFLYERRTAAIQAQREKREHDEFAAFRKENPLIKEQFEDLKRQLANVSEEEWKGIPEIGDYTIKRRKRFETFSAISDNLLAGSPLATGMWTVRACQMQLSMSLCCCSNLLCVWLVGNMTFNAAGVSGWPISSRGLLCRCSGSGYRQHGQHGPGFRFQF
jgi:hypothetical protein